MQKKIIFKKQLLLVVAISFCVNTYAQDYQKQALNSIGTRSLKSNLFAKYDKKNIRISVVSMDEASLIFGILALNKEIPFAYLEEDGSYVRAFQMVKILEESNIIAGKAFMEGNLWTYADNEKFGYHFMVAPVLLIKIGDSSVPHIFDPSISKYPLSIKQWRERYTDFKSTLLTDEYFTSRFHMIPIDKKIHTKITMILIMMIRPS